MAGEYAKQFKDVTSTQSVDQQAMTFLRAFVGEFQGKFEEVLQLAEEFKSFATKSVGAHIRELDEFEAHVFLEKKGETKTVSDLREKLKDIDLDSNNKVSFIEYLLFKYKKTPKDLFTAKPNSVALAKLEKAIEQYKAVFEEKRKKEEQMKSLESVANGSGPDAAKAKAELRRLQMEDPANHTKNEMAALQSKLAAKRALKNPGEDEARAFEEEKKKVEEEKRQKELEEKKKRDEARAKMKAKASAFETK